MTPAYSTYRARFRCPYPGCDHATASEVHMRKHLANEHQRKPGVIFEALVLLAHRAAAQRQGVRG